MRFLKPLFFFLLILALASCGQKGPLYLPDTAQPPAGEAEDSDESESKKAGP